MTGSLGSSAENLEPAALVALAVVGFLAGSILVITIGLSGIIPDSTPASQLQDYQNNRTVFTEFAVGWIAVALVAIPFVVVLGVHLRKKNLFLASAGTALWALGISMLAFASASWVGALAGIDAASGSAPSAADATYQAGVVSTLAGYPTSLGWAAFGAGFFLIAWLARGSGTIPNWLAILGLIGGVGSAPIGPLPEMVGSQVFGIWAFALGVIFLYRARARLIPVGIAFLAIFFLFGPPINGAIPGLLNLTNNPLGIYVVGAGIAMILLGLKSRSDVRRLAASQVSK